MTTEPWQRYFDEFRGRAERIPEDAFDRSALLYEAAHDTYQNTTNELTSAGWDEELALMLGRIFGSAVKEWLAAGSPDIERLHSDLERRYGEWNGVD